MTGAEGVPGQEMQQDGVNRPINDPQLFMLVVPATLSHVESVRYFIDSLPLASRLSDERIFDMKVVVSEAVANAIEHAGAEVRVWAWLLRDRTVIEVANKGDFGMKSDGQPSERQGGFGLRLMVSLADEVTFVGARRGTTKVRLTFDSHRHGGSARSFWPCGT